MSYAKRVRDAENMIENALHDLKCSNPTLIIDKKNKIVFANKVKYNTIYTYLYGDDFACRAVSVVAVTSASLFYR